MKCLNLLLLMAIAISVQTDPAARPMRNLVFGWSSAGEPGLSFHSVVAAAES